MDRFRGMRFIAGAFLVGVFVAGIGESLAQPLDGQNAHSGGTQGLQEKMYQERMKELQNQPPAGTQQPQGAGSSVGGPMSGDGASKSQGTSEGRTGSSGSGRQADQQMQRK